jgi:p-aminobenzoyl-glutamate transporter AbgT
MRNFDAYVTNIVYGIILLLGYNFCGIIPTILGFLTWFLIDKILEPKFADEKKAESSRSRTRPASFMAVPEDTDGFLPGVVASFFR